MYDPRKHNYYQKVIELFEQGKVPPGCIREVDVWHDEWCDIYRGGYCNCEPEVTVRPPPEQN
jgi:hypothetical protein